QAARPASTASRSPSPTTRKRRTWRTPGRSSRTRGPSARRFGPGSYLLPAVLVLRGRQVREVALDARSEVVRVGRLHDAQRRLPLRALPAAAGIGPDARAEPGTEPRPLRADDDRDSQCEQGDVQPAHNADLS